MSNLTDINKSDMQLVVGGSKTVKKIIAKKKISDEEMEKYVNGFVKPSMIHTILREDADVFTEDGKLLLRYRKNALNMRHVKEFYDNVIGFAQNVSGNRGNATGSKSKSVYNNPRVMSNIIGYFDRFPPVHKLSFKKAGFTPLEVRPCRFNQDYPEKYKKLIPMIQDVDKLYKRYTPDHYAKQYRKARQTHFKIPGTSFTTITTNVNFRTSIHTDKGDDQEGFGNLVVIEDGKYKGGETCFPQYGLGVDVRTGDVLFMDVHQLHGNLPMELVDKDAKRLSVVCYLRYKLWLRTKNKTRRFYEKHNKTLRRLTKPDKK
jgi:Oxygenase domain of the 2OGFeDO superfamily